MNEYNELTHSHGPVLVPRERDTGSGSRSARSNTYSNIRYMHTGVPTSTSTTDGVEVTSFDSFVHSFVGQCMRM